MNELSKSVLQCIKQSPGIKARAIAAELSTNITIINRLIYSQLTNVVKQDPYPDYGWRLKKDTSFTLPNGYIWSSKIRHCSIKEVTNNPILSECYHQSGCENLLEFLEMGNNRFSLNGYDKNLDRLLLKSVDQFITLSNSHDKQSINTTVEKLLNGNGNTLHFRGIDIDKITDDIILQAAFDESKAIDVASFLELGASRLLIDHYSARCEKRLKEGIKIYLEKRTSHQEVETNKDTDPNSVPLKSSNFTGHIGPTGNNLAKHEIKHANLIKLTLNPTFQTSYFAPSQWEQIRSSVKESELSSEPVLAVALRIGAKWPLKSKYSKCTISDYLDLNLDEFRQLRGFGRKKTGAYLACVTYLHELITVGRLNLHEYTNLDSMIASIWNNCGLLDTEKSIIKHRFGIQMRKHTLVEIAASHDVTRERVHQMEKTAITKIEATLNQGKLSEMLTEKRDLIWDALSPRKETISKSVDLDNLEDNLTFETHLAIELYVDRRSRSTKQAALGDWLNEQFEHDESNWYKSRSQSINPTTYDTSVNESLSNFLDTI